MEWVFQIDGPGGYVSTTRIVQSVTVGLSTERHVSGITWTTKRVKETASVFKFGAIQSRPVTISINLQYEAYYEGVNLSYCSTRQSRANTLSVRATFSHPYLNPYDLSPKRLPIFFPFFFSIEMWHKGK